MYFYTVLGIGFLFFIFLKIRKPPDKKSESSTVGDLNPKVKKTDRRTGVLMVILTICLVAGIFGYAGYKATEVHAKITSAHPTVRANLYHKKPQTATQDGDPVEVKMLINEVIRMDIPSSKSPYMNWGCPKIIEPEGLNHDKVKFELIAGANTNTNYIALDEESQIYMGKLTKSMKVLVTLVQVPMGPETPCAYLKK